QRDRLDCSFGRRMLEAPHGATHLPEAEVRSYLEALLAAPILATSKRRGELLRYLVTQTLHGKADSISEYGIGLDVYGKDESFDPRLESTVRSDISRLRKLLTDYYAGSGARDPWRIEIPKRGYAPVILPQPIRPQRTTEAYAKPGRSGPWVKI